MCGDKFFGSRGQMKPLVGDGRGGSDSAELFVSVPVIGGDVVIDKHQMVPAPIPTQPLHKIGGLPFASDEQNTAAIRLAFKLGIVDGGSAEARLIGWLAGLVCAAAPVDAV